MKNLLTLNVEKFKEMIQKGTVNYLIESIGLVIDKDKVKCNMISKDRNVVIFINKPNEIIEGLIDTVYFNFTEPNNKVKPYLNILDDNVVPISIAETKVRINKQLTLNFDDESVIDVFGKDKPKSDFTFFHDFDIDDDFMGNFNKIKKIGNKFEKIYFSIDENKLYIETTDKTNKYSNGAKYHICDIEHEDMTLCFKYKNFINLMSLVDGDDFNIKFSYMKENKLGLIAIFKKDDTEKYYLMSILDQQ